MTDLPNPSAALLILKTLKDEIETIETLLNKVEDGEIGYIIEGIINESDRFHTGLSAYTNIVANRKKLWPK